MTSTSNENFPVSLASLTQEALCYETPLKMQTLFAVRGESKKLKTLAKETLKNAQGNQQNSPVSASHAKSVYTQADSWKKGHKQKELSQAVLQEIFTKTEPCDQDELIRFFVGSGGRLADILSYHEKSFDSHEIEEKVKQLDLIRRTILIVEKELKEKNDRMSVSPDPSIKKKVFFDRIIKKEPLPSAFIQEEGLAKIKAFFESAIREMDPVKSIHTIASKRYLELLDTLIEGGFDINALSSATGGTPLHAAAYKGDVELVEWLLAHGAAIEAETLAQDNQQSKVVEDKDTALHLACFQGKLEVVKLLVERGGNLHALTSFKNTPLHYACSQLEGEQKPCAELARFLIDKGASLEEKNYFGETPLHVACLYGDPASARLLMERGADLGALNRVGLSPFQKLIQDPSTSQKAKKLLGEIFSSYPEVIHIIETKDLKDLLAHFKEYPEELIDKNKPFSQKNPLELPFLFHDMQILGQLKSIMSVENFEIAVTELQRKYPTQNLKKVIDCDAKIQPSIVYQLNEEREIAPLPPLRLATLFNIFKDSKLFITKRVKELNKKELFFDDNGNLFQRKVINSPEGDDCQEVTLTKMIGTEEFEETSLDLLELDKSGTICVGQTEYPYLLLKIGQTMMPISIMKEKGEVIVEVRLELLKPLFSRINFSDESAAGYRNPESIVDAGSSEGSKPVKVPPKTLRKGLQNLVNAINYRIPYLGTPPKNTPELEAWYRKLEGYVKHLIIHSLEEDPNASLEAFPKEKINAPFDPTPWAPTIIELAIAGTHCGTRLYDDSKSLLETAKGEPKSLEESVLHLFAKIKNGFAQKLAIDAGDHDVHVKNMVLQVIDEAFGIPESEKRLRCHFNDPCVPSSMNKEGIPEAFNEAFIPTILIDTLDHAIHDKFATIDRDLVIDWFKDHIPSHWEQKYKEISKGLESIETKREKADYLKGFDIYTDERKLAKDDEPDWQTILEEAQKYLFIENEVMDMESGKIKRTALIYMLKQFGVLQA